MSEGSSAASHAASAAAPIAALPRPLARRLRELWRSAGWPCRDPLEAELLARGLLERRCDAAGRETLHLTEPGVHALAASHQRNREALSPHQQLVERVAQQMSRAGRVVWCGLGLRAPLPGDEGGTRWPVAMPDVYSIRHTTREDRVDPIVHEVKVSRADLQSDLRRPDKRAAYLALSSECWYVLKAGIATADEVPADCGVMVATPTSLEVLRPAPRRAMRLPFAVWMSLARAAPRRGDDDDPAQALLGAPDDLPP